MHYANQHHPQALILSLLYPTLEQCLNAWNFSSTQQITLKNDSVSKEYVLIQYGQQNQMLQQIHLKTRDMEDQHPVSRYHLLSWILNQLNASSQNDG